MATNATSASRISAWASHAPEEAEIDEPPERQLHKSSQKFQRTTVKKQSGQSSLLTKAFMGQSDEDAAETINTALVDIHRRRSMTSNVSVASTADLTSDTGLTSPARTNTPSPPLPNMTLLRLDGHHTQPKKDASEAPRKRCIQFACAAKPTSQEQAVTHLSPVTKSPAPLEAARRPCIKFACTTRSDSARIAPANQTHNPSSRPQPTIEAESPSTPKKISTLSAGINNISPRFAAAKRSPNQTTVKRPRYLSANSTDLSTDASQFHEFASGVTREEDWIRQTGPTKARLTIYDTLSKENDIRRLATEAEEEAELEEEEEEAALDDDDDDAEELDDEDGDENEEDQYDDPEYSESDGYHTDEETGFAESDSEDEEDENMVMWTPGRPAVPMNKGELPAMRRPSLQEQHSDSSNATTNGKRVSRTTASRRIKPQPEAVDLPDSTDFVCGTLDEDRPLEDAYLSNLTARRNEKLRVIPQDIDPSFPASGPEDDDEEEVYNPVHHDSDENVWMQGEMEDLHHDQDRSRRRRKSEQASPRKYHSPPPKRFHSPPPKHRARARSPVPLFDRHSPRRQRSPAPKIVVETPTVSPRHGGRVEFQLGGRPGLTQTKSLPRPAALFPHFKSARHNKMIHHDDIHVRGAIDIVKGLEKKRQRRKEKFHQKYCNRARRGQIPERKPQPGKGAERMKELGLLMAGKKDQGNYVLSI